jgi:glycerol-3-phosphate dehydrogenase (NAD(P)+)
VTKMLFEVVFNGFEIPKAIEFLINYPYDVDVDFL